MEISGRIKLIGETKTFGAKGFRKRELVLTTEEVYPQHILIEFVQDKSELLDKYSVGEGVSIGLNLRGREWTNPEGEVKYFTSIQGWKIEPIKKPESSAPFPPQNSFDTTEKNDYSSPKKEAENQEDDLPF